MTKTNRKLLLESNLVNCCATMQKVGKHLVLQKKYPVEFVALDQLLVIVLHLLVGINAWLYNSVSQDSKDNRPSDTLGLLSGCIYESKTQKFNVSKDGNWQMDLFGSLNSVKCYSSVVVYLYTTCHFTNTNCNWPFTKILKPIWTVHSNYNNASVCKMYKVCVSVYMYIEKSRVQVFQNGEIILRSLLKNAFAVLFVYRKVSPSRSDIYAKIKEPSKA